MLIIIVVLITCIPIICMYAQWIRLKQYWVNRNISHVPSPNPLLGSLTFLQKENPALWFRRIYNTYKDPYVGIWMFWRPALVVNSTEIAKNILIKDQANFRNRLVSSGTTDPVGRLNLFTLNDPLWSVIRRRLSVFFTSSKLRNVQTLLTQKSWELVQRIENDRQKKEPTNLRIVMTDFATDVIGSASFGVVTDATLTGTSPLRNITKEFMKYSFLRGLAWCSAFFIPELVDFFRFKVFPKESTEYMRDILRKIIAQRGGLENIVTEPKDLLDILIKIRQEADKDLNMTENMMLAQAALFLQAGFDTSSNALSFAIYELAYCPDSQEKLYQELLETKTVFGGNFLDSNVLSPLICLNCVINGTKYPVAGWIDRVALKDYKVDEHLTIEAGTPICINVAGMHYDPESYPEPDLFKPDRFLPENEVNIKPFSFLPFGDGPRKCIGQRFGLSNVRHGLAAVILHYEVRPLPHAPKPAEVKLVKEGILIAPEDLLSVEFVPRK